MDKSNIINNKEQFQEQVKDYGADLNSFPKTYPCIIVFGHEIDGYDVVRSYEIVCLEDFNTKESYYG